MSKLQGSYGAKKRSTRRRSTDRQLLWSCCLWSASTARFASR